MFCSGVFIYALPVVLKKIIHKTMAEKLQIPVIPKISVSSVILLFLITTTIILFLVYLFLIHQTLPAARNNGLYDEDDEHENEENEGDISHDESGLEDYRAELRGYRKRLRDKDIVNQLQQMEDTLGWIIKTTEDDPDTVHMVRRLLEYYMPKTSHLLKTYADVEKYPQKGKNISKIMAEVKEALELLNSGMENALDDMYQGKEMDISSDISVMKEMMVQDGMQEQYPDFHPGT
jgi:5-bromo-4-chloroindolyl phosphate hydrolysis protein